jgi:hypothetical protein
MTTTSSPRNHLDIVELRPGLRFSKGTLQDLLPDVETTLFFGKVYDLDAQQLGALLLITTNTDVALALLGEGGQHSNELQDYVLDICDQLDIELEDGDISVGEVPVQGEILPELWSQLEVEVTSSIKAVAEKLSDVVTHMPGKQGHMLFKSMRVMNARRPILGDYKATIQHARQKRNLVIFDVSGSVSAGTVEAIVEDVVSMSYMANADLAIVSDYCTYWEAGTFNVDDVLAAATYGGTHYEQLAPLFDRDWGTVVTVADYDSSYDAIGVIANCSGRIDEVLDISLVNRPTVLAEVVGQLADSVRPLLTATSYVTRPSQLEL